MTGAPLIEVRDLRRRYTRGDVDVPAVDGVDLVVHAGETLAVEGSSGSGKSTLLAVLGGLERPSSGSVLFDGRDLALLSDRELTALRAREIGFVFQSFNLVPTLTAQQNVEAVMAPLHLSSSAQRARARDLLERVGLGARAGYLPSTMSGGEQQRVAVARAIANNPRVILADEPTGNLDSATAEEVVSLLRGLTTELGVTVVLVTHDHELAMQAGRRVVMRDGRVVAGDPGRPRLVLVPAPETARPPALPRSVAWIGRAAAAVALTGTAVAVSHVSSGAPRTRPIELSAAAPSHVRVIEPPRSAPLPAPTHAPQVAPLAQESEPPQAEPHTPVVRHTTASRSKPAAPRRTPVRKPVVPVVTKPAPVPAKPTPSPVPPPADETPAPDPAPTTGTTAENPLWWMFPLGWLHPGSAG